MAKIDKTKPVLVTGANGYVASWLVKKLLEEGMTVHAAVRDPENEKKLVHLKKVAASSPGKLIFFRSDLLRQGSYRAAMEGCELVFHTASPFIISVKDPQKELIEPAVKGTENVLNTANEVESVKRVVITSSCAAIYTDAIDTVNAPEGRLTEEVWNTTASLDYQPYFYSKTLAEKRAWEIAATQNRWDLVAMNMPMVLGPSLNPEETTSESLNLLKQMGDGTFKSGAPRFGMGLVDVRDVAEAHYRAGFTPEAKGRYITSAHESNLFELSLLLRPKYGKHFPTPKSAAPKWLLLLIGPMLNKVLTRKFIRNNVDIPWRADNSKITRDLGMTFRTAEETMNESFYSLIESGLLKAKG